MREEPCGRCGVPAPPYYGGLCVECKDEEDPEGRIEGYCEFCGDVLDGGCQYVRVTGTDPEWGDWEEEGCTRMRRA